MDPDANLKELRELFATLREQDTDGIVYDWHDLARIAELAEALDEWISNGGFLPAAWKR